MISISIWMPQRIYKGKQSNPEHGHLKENPHILVQSIEMHSPKGDNAIILFYNFINYMSSIWQPFLSTINAVVSKEIKCQNVFYFKSNI